MVEGGAVSVVSKRSKKNVKGQPTDSFRGIEPCEDSKKVFVFRTDIENRFRTSAERKNANDYHAGPEQNKQDEEKHVPTYSVLGNRHLRVRRFESLVNISRPLVFIR